MIPLTVIIPSRNPDNAIACVRAIRDAKETCSIIVVNDFRTTADQVKACELFRPELNASMIEGVKPFVFARNVNRGILRAGYSDVVVMNDDALLQSEMGLSKLQALSCDMREHGLFSAACNNVGNPNQHQRRIQSFRDENRMVCFVCVLIPFRTVAHVGLLDERFVGYGCEDDDYSLRVRKADLKIGIYDGCFVDHGSLHSSFRAENGGGNFLPNMKLFIEKHGHDNWGRDRAHSPFAHMFPEAESVSACTGCAAIPHPKTNPREPVFRRNQR